MFFLATLKMVAMDTHVPSNHFVASSIRFFSLLVSLYVSYYIGIHFWKQSTTNYSLSQAWLLVLATENVIATALATKDNPIMVHRILHLATLTERFVLLNTSYSVGLF